MTELRFPADHIVGTLDWPTAFDPETGPVVAVVTVTVPEGVRVRLEVQSMTGTRPTARAPGNCRTTTVRSTSGSSGGCPQV